jgi:hypothetical protein
MRVALRFRIMIITKSTMPVANRASRWRAAA